jgi:hypothetical protein
MGFVTDPARPATRGLHELDGAGGPWDLGSLQDLGPWQESDPMSRRK